MYQPGRILTHKGHAEFDTFVNSGTKSVWPVSGVDTGNSGGGTGSCCGGGQCAVGCGSDVEIFGEDSEPNLTKDVTIVGEDAAWKLR